MTRRIRLEVLDEGDEVIGFSENRIAIKKSNGDTEIITLLIEEGDIPTIDERVIVITKKTTKANLISVKSDDGSFEVGSF